MKTELYFLITLLAFFLLIVLPKSFAQGTLAQPSVRLVYFLPKDRAVRPDRITAFRKIAEDVQQFYADEMERHGYGRKTFTIESNKRGVSVVHRVDGKFNEDYYYDPLTEKKIFKEVSERFDEIQHVYFIAIDQQMSTKMESSTRLTCSSSPQVCMLCLEKPLRRSRQQWLKTG